MSEFGQALSLVPIPLLASPMTLTLHRPTIAHGGDLKTKEQTPRPRPSRSTVVAKDLLKVLPL